MTYKGTLHKKNTQETPFGKSQFACHELMHQNMLAPQLRRQVCPDTVKENWLR